MNNINTSFQFLKKGNDLKKKILDYNIKREIDLNLKIIKIFKEINFDKYKNDSKDNIIFILGMPRSGTSLVEQIISSHSEVFGGGELPILSNIIKTNFMENQEIDPKKIYNTIKDLLKIKSINLEYHNFINHFNFKEKFITDKAPLNFRWIGFIKMIFPNAKIIHCTRNPKNNCLSLYKNLFEGGLGFTYDEDDLVLYYNSYLSLMNFWNSKIHNDILSLSYESLINNQEQQIKKIIQYCQLSWEDNCLAFHKNKSPIKTMSTAQARRPIYKSSLDAFEKYKKLLKKIDKNL